MKTNLRSGTRRAFTLVELLVVVAIIAILAGLLLSGISHWRNRVSTLQCVTNVRHIGQAFASYAADNAGNFPAVVEQWTGEEFVENDTVWSSELVLKHYLQEPTSRADAVFLCPFDTGFNEEYAEAYRCYAYNPGEIGSIADKTIPFKPLQVTNPARTILLAEWYEPDPGTTEQFHATWDWEFMAYRNSGGIYPHHPDGSSTVLFYDLHVETPKAVATVPTPGVPLKWSFK